MHGSRITLRAFLGAFIVIVLLPTPAFGVARSVIIARGKVWVDRNVRYSQSRYAQVNGTMIPTSTPLSTAMTQGYRTDCSGFVSMALGLTNSRGLPLSLATASMRSVLTTIPKDELLPGDVILRPSNIGYSYGHAVLFVRWANAAHTAYWSYEESGSNRGTITRLVSPYPFFGAKGFRAYRYVKVDDYYADCQESIYGPTSYDTAVAASRVACTGTIIPGSRGLVVANGEAWTGNLGGAALAGAAGGPLLHTSRGSLPATAAAAIKRLQPAVVFVIGGPSVVSTAVSEKIASFGPRVVRIGGRDRYATAARAARTAVDLASVAGCTPDTAYLVGKDAFCDGLAVSPVAAKTARPILLTRRLSVPAATLDELKADGIKRVVVIGSSSVVDGAVVRTLRRRGITVTRLAGTNRYATALAVARHGAGLGAGLTWTSLGVASGTSLKGTLACGVAQGEAGSLLLLTPSTSLSSTTAGEITRQRAVIGKVRVFGSYSALGTRVRGSIAKIMRAQ